MTKRSISVESSSSSKSIVDLTVDSDIEEIPLLDLTSPIRKAMTNRVVQDGGCGTGDAIVIPEFDDEDAVIVLSPKTSHHHSIMSQTPTPTPEVDDEDAVIVLSPTKTSHLFSNHSITIASVPPTSTNDCSITCPVCMENVKTFTKSGRLLVTTKCGHLFCNSCIRQSITLLHRCPTCSGKLTLKQYHRIYI